MGTWTHPALRGSGNPLAAITLWSERRILTVRVASRTVGSLLSRLGHSLTASQLCPRFLHCLPF
jgi:hypothetical protein